MTLVQCSPATREKQETFQIPVKPSLYETRGKTKAQVMKKKPQRKSKERYKQLDISSTSKNRETNKHIVMKDTATMEDQVKNW